MEISYDPIAYFESSHTETYEAPRQGVLAESSFGVINIDEKISEAAFEDLKGFERIWLIYDFHKNKTWKPKVRPPRFSEKKRSVFSTRSPYRPNSIGISCVKLEKIERTKLYISEHDLLEGTPILDIKPYLPYADSFEGVKTGWVKDLVPYEVLFSDKAKEQISWLKEKVDFDVESILKNQLAYEPTNSKIKRVKASEENFVFAIRTWRFKFEILDRVVKINSIFSGYTNLEIESSEDPYLDKNIHRWFIENFKQD